MNYILLYEAFNKEQSQYKNWEKGLIKAWGSRLYLGYYGTKLRHTNLVSSEVYQNHFLEYYTTRDPELIEDYDDWLSDPNPTERRIHLYDKTRMGKTLTQMANRTRLKKPLTVYRLENPKEPADWQSYSINDKEIESYQDISYNRTFNEYELPIGFPVIFADGIADEHEVILKMTEREKSKYKKK